jgi:hypothetical protein
LYRVAAAVLDPLLLPGTSEMMFAIERIIN